MNVDGYYVPVHVPNTTGVLFICLHAQSSFEWRKCTEMITGEEEERTHTHRERENKKKKLEAGARMDE